MLNNVKNKKISELEQPKIESRKSNLDAPKRQLPKSQPVTIKPYL